jgi:hypothetical protein
MRENSFRNLDGENEGRWDGTIGISSLETL